ncbi:hypothetical protein BO70DRAFT_290755 [Aspergillus heteromorphus CBS 117.55]|uniref:C2H2-type domain-containing protein n=1 Tax=Aspergillus heteromorphus CBS 117.55 TaxID=1448321 RepID=A0A317WB32_9EURO|nr:uncharacterized protein BO70DRAFT_290755 [Aspergillus heteromorphus CBS 117.55]PWY83553.1 hypothetical protein BO70DRAFT_290755 [Aspergillus heteromorphus CBS 117.55]
MGSGLDALAPQPLNSRRPAAPVLPSFELPAPNFHAGSGAVKYAQHLQHSQHSQHAHPPPIGPSVSNLLTPPATSQSADNVPNSYPSASGTAAAAAARQSWSYPSRDAFSPPQNPLNRNPATSSAEHIPQPYEVNHLPPFHQSIPVSAQPASQQHHAMAHAMMSAHNPLPNPAPSPHSLPSNDPYMVKSSSAPAYSTVSQLSSPPGGYSPYGQTGLGIQPRVASNPVPPHHLNYNSRQAWPSYSLPAMNGPVWTNVHNPGGHMALTGGMHSGVLPGLPGYNSGHVANMQHMQQLYGGHPPHGHAPGPANDRPFKCDQCPQSFNRNHDLKRHKRIHLSVKPFPCSHCDKSFSRKDALKRHILVKGCGKDGDGKPSDGGLKEEEDRESSGHS